MKVLIIEDSKYKFEHAISVLQENGISEYVHFNNFQEANKFAIRKKNIQNFDLIILDMNFYLYRPFVGRDLPDKQAGAMFLYQLLDNGLKTPVIIFSSETDYMSVLKKFMFPSLSEYAKHFVLPMSLEHIESRYNSHLDKNNKLLSELDFVIGQAHHELELNHLLTVFLNQ